MCPKHKASGGFTLVEIMVVMVIITIVTAFALPALRTNLFSDQLKSTARKIIGLVSEASQEAVRSQSVYLLNFDFEGNRIWMSGGKSASTDEETDRKQELDLPDSVRVVDISSVHGGKEGQGEAVIRFTTQGYVDKTLIHLRSDDGRDLTIMLSPFIATTKVMDSYVALDDEKARY